MLYERHYTGALAYHTIRYTIYHIPLTPVHICMQYISIAYNSGVVWFGVRAGRADIEADGTDRAASSQGAQLLLYQPARNVAHTVLELELR